MTRIYRSISAVGERRISAFLFWYVCISWNARKLMYFDCQCRYAVGAFWRIVWTNYAYAIKMLRFTRVSTAHWKRIVWTDTYTSFDSEVAVKALEANLKSGIPRSQETWMKHRYVRKKVADCERRSWNRDGKSKGIYRSSDILSSV